MARRSGTEIAEPQVVVSGDVPAADLEEIRRKIAALARYSAEPIGYARVRVTRAPDPAVARPVIAQANLSVNGRLARAQVAAGTVREAIDLLRARLQQRLTRQTRLSRLGRLSRHARQRPAHYGQPPGERPEFFRRPVEERELVRRKGYAPTFATPEDAVGDLELLDYDFYLFTDRDSGQDAVVYRAGPTGYRLAAVAAPELSWPEPAVPLTVSPQPAPRLTVPAAIERLNLTGTPFLFFADVASGRGQVLYRRYDGHYGLIAPADM